MSPASAPPSSRSWPRVRSKPSPKPRRRWCRAIAPSSPKPRQPRLIRISTEFTGICISDLENAGRRPSKSETFCPNCEPSPREPGKGPVLESLRAEVLEANLELVRRGLVLYTFGNASAVSRVEGLVVIKPSGVPYDKMTPADMVITDLEGRIVEGDLRPSSDLATHVALYRAWPEIGGVVHTHSRHATAWAQASREIPCFGTTHADYFPGPVPVTEPRHT